MLIPVPCWTYNHIAFNSKWLMRKFTEIFNRIGNQNIIPSSMILKIGCRSTILMYLA